MKDADSDIKAQAKTPEDFSIDQFYYRIPRFQRTYAWNEDEVFKLLADVYNYYSASQTAFREKMTAGQASRKFIGALILVKAESFSIGRDVYDVIDGQQRLTTLQIACFTLAVRLITRVKDLVAAYGSVDKAVRAQVPNAEQLLSDAISDALDVAQNLAQTTYSPLNIRKYRPYLFREDQDDRFVEEDLKELSYADRTDYKSETAKAFRTLARFFWTKKQHEQRCNPFYKLDAGNFLIDFDRRKSFDNEWTGQYRKAVDTTDDFLKIVESGVIWSLEADEYAGHHGRALDLIADAPREDASARGSNEEFVSGSKWLTTLYGQTKSDLSSLQNAFDAFKGRAEFDKCADTLKQLARLMMFKEFFTRNLCFVHIVCSTTEALDIFQTINTAGKPLSCIETFLPEGYRFVARNDLEALAQKQTIPGVGTWMGHSLEELMEMINDLSALITELKLSVPEIVTTFAFVYDGTKLGKNLIDQRQYLTNGLRGAVKKAQSNAKGKAPQEELLKPIYQYFLVLYLTIKWRLYLEWEKRVNPASASPKNSAQQRLDELFNAGPFLADDVELQFALGVIRESNLSLPLSVMCRYFIKWQIDGKPESAKDMTQASKALLSFAALWLSGSKGTSGIDQAFRDFMCSKDKNQKQAKAQGASVALCSDAQLNVEMLRNHLFERYCEKKNNNKSLKGWISALKSAAVAKDRVAIARFLQMLYLENSEEDPKSPIGVRKSVSRPQSAGQTLLSPTGWRSVRALELEHILPQKPKDPWDKLLKNCEGDDDKVRRINQLGNVMYLPKTINIIVGNRPWNQKKMFYMALADNSGKAVDNLRARQQQLQLSMDDIDNLEEKKKLINNYGRSEWPKGYDSLAQWKEYTIDNRTAAIAEILWPHLCAWLGVDANQLGATAQTQSQPNPQAAPASANGTGTTPNKKQKGEAAPENQPAPAQVANQPAQKRGIDRLMAAAEKLVSSILGQGQTDGDKIEWIVQKSQARLSAGEQGIELFLSGLDGFRIRDNRNHQRLKDGHKLTYKTRNAFNEGEGALKKVLKRWLKKIVPGTRV